MGSLQRSQMSAKGFVFAAKFFGAMEKRCAGFRSFQAAQLSRQCDHLFVHRFSEETRTSGRPAYSSHGFPLNITGEAHRASHRTIRHTLHFTAFALASTELSRVRDGAPLRTATE